MNYPRIPLLVALGLFSLVACDPRNIGTPMDDGTSSGGDADSDAEGGDGADGGGQTSGGGDGSDGGGSDPWDPCGPEDCGRTCSLCDPNDPDCVETAELKVCDGEGRCVSDTGAITCDPVDPPSRCELKPDPGPCEAAFPGWYFDPDTGTCEEFIWGGCDGTLPFETLESCQASCEDGPIPSPCAGAACGTPCSLCGQDGTTPAGQSCQEPSGGVCDGEGQCVSGDILCQEPEACGPNSCGDSCEICEQGQCSAGVCDSEGACQDQFDPRPIVCEQDDPCADKMCGDPCSFCAANDPDCVEPPVVLLCDEVGECTTGVPECR